MNAPGQGRKPKPLEKRLAEGEGNNGRAINGKNYNPDDFDSGPSTDLAIPAGSRVGPHGAVELIPVCPTPLSERGQSEWNAIWSVCWWLGTEHDYRQVEMIAKNYDLIERWESQLDEYRESHPDLGDCVIGKFGVQEEHPLLKAIDRKNDRLIRLFSELGIGPISRARIGIVLTKGKIGLEKLKQEQAKTQAAETESFKLAWNGEQ